MIQEKINNVEIFSVLIMLSSTKWLDFLVMTNIPATNQKICFILQDQINLNLFVVLWVKKHPALLKYQESNDQTYKLIESVEMTQKKW